MTGYEKSSLPQCRLDLWLWAARFYKTRNLAASKIKKGFVQLSGKKITKPASLLNEGSRIVIEQDWVRKTILVEQISLKRVSFEKAKAFYKIIATDSLQEENFFQAREKYTPNKRERRNLKVLKEKLHFLSEN